MPKTGDIVTDDQGNRYIVGARIRSQKDLALEETRDAYLEILRTTYDSVEVKRFIRDNASIGEILANAERRGWPSFHRIDWLVLSNLYSS